MVSLSEFSCTPTNLPTNSLTNDEGGAQTEQVHSPDHIQMDVEIPRVQVTGYPIEVEVKQTPMPFPPTPEQTEVSESGPVIKPNSYRDIKDSLYFQENMVKKKQTKKLSEKEKENLLMAGKQPRKPIPATPLMKKGTGNKAARKEVDNTVKAGKRAPRKSAPATGGVTKPH